MNKKFVKENKTLVREFISGLIASIVAGKLSKGLEKKLMAKPETRKSIERIRTIRKSMETKLDKIKRDDPEFYKRIQSTRF